MKHCCNQMQRMIDEEKSIGFIPEFREYGVPVRDGGSSFLQMEYCPWCGVRLPASLREEYRCSGTESSSVLGNISG